MVYEKETNQDHQTTEGWDQRIHRTFQWAVLTMTSHDQEFLQVLVNNAVNVMNVRNVKNEKRKENNCFWRFSKSQIRIIYTMYSYEDKLLGFMG